MKRAAASALLLLAAAGPAPSQSYEAARKTALSKLGGWMFFADCGIASKVDLTIANLQAISAMDKAAKAEGKTLASDEYFEADVGVERDKAAKAAAKPNACSAVIVHQELIRGIYAQLDQMHAWFLTPHPGNPNP